MKHKKGVSIAEAVVAMSLITVISVVAISTIKRAINFANKSEMADAARTTAQNALECFKYAPDGQTFYGLIPREKMLDDTVIPEDFGKQQYVYAYGILYRLTVTADYGGPGTEDDYFSAYCMDEKGRRMFFVDYKKG